MAEKIGWFELNVADKERMCPAFLIFLFTEDRWNAKGDAYYPEVILDLEESDDGDTFIGGLYVTVPEIAEYNDLAVKLLGLIRNQDYTTPTQIAAVLSEFLHDGMPSEMKERYRLR